MDDRTRSDVELARREGCRASRGIISKVIFVTIAQIVGYVSAQDFCLQDVLFRGAPRPSEMASQVLIFVERTCRIMVRILHCVGGASG